MVEQNEQRCCCGWSLLFTTKIMLHTDSSMLFIWSYQHALASEISVNNVVNLFNSSANKCAQVCYRFSPYRPVLPLTLAPSLASRLKTTVGILSLLVHRFDGGEA
jgi:hypothetical protein